MGEGLVVVVVVVVVAVGAAAGVTVAKLERWCYPILYSLVLEKPSKLQDVIFRGWLEFFGFSREQIEKIPNFRENAEIN